MKNTLDKIGMLTLTTVLVILILRFGFTFGTIFTGTLGIIIIGLIIITRLAKKNRKALFIRNIALILIIIWFISFIFIELNIFIGSIPDKEVKCDYIVILGASVKGEKLSFSLENRLNKAKDYLKENPNIKIIVSGGQGDGEYISEAEAMKRYLIQNGIKENNIIKEDKSTNTYENIVNSKKIIDSFDGKNEKVLIVTSDYHMYRAKVIAKDNNIEAYGIPSKTPFFLLLNHYIREYFAIIKMKLFLLFE